jgi:hypothetical protein
MQQAVNGNHHFRHYRRRRVHPAGRLAAAAGWRVDAAGSDDRAAVRIGNECEPASPAYAATGNAELGLAGWRAAQQIGNLIMRWCQCRSCWVQPSPWWLMQRGYMLQPCTRGWPVRAKVGFCPNPVDWRMPRLPWPYETESRAPGTGLVMGKMPC